MTVDLDACGLLRALARNTGEDGSSTLGLLAAQIRNWNAVLNLAQEHRVLPLLVYRLAEAEASIPSDVLQLLRAESDRNAFHCLANASELIAICEAFDKASIPLLPFKGVALAASVYASLTSRSAGDLDFLVFYRDLRSATLALQARGYELKTPARQDGSPAVENYYEFHFERPADGMVVELRWRLELTQPRFRRDLGMAWLWPRRGTIRVAGKDVPDLNPEDKLLVLCMHGCKHQWSRLIWICDVAQLIEKEPQLDWEDVAREAKRRGLWRALALGVLLARQVCGSRVPEPTLRSFESDPAAYQLSKHFSTSLLDAPGQIPPGRLPYNFRLLDSGDRLRLVLSGDLLRPNDRDLAAVRLPPGLRPLYYLVRPLRMLFDKSAR